MDMRTPLRKVRGLGSAKQGSEHFWTQRLTALANIPLIGLFVLLIVFNIGADHAEASAMLRQPAVALIFLLIVISSAIHMRLGMQVIIEDYVHHEGLKVLAVAGNIFFCITVALTALLAVLKLWLGG